MVISSRTPEGSPNQCPICEAIITIEPSQPTGDAPCLHCGNLLWFSAALMRHFDHTEVRPFKESFLQILCENLGINPDTVRDSDTILFSEVSDSLDIVELIMLSEEEFEVTIPLKEARNLKTVGDVIDCFFRHGFRRKKGQP